VVYKDKIVMRPTLQEALEAIFGPINDELITNAHVRN
jgi:uncharacterized membrane protein (UPF0182 family)